MAATCRRFMAGRGDMALLDCYHSGFERGAADAAKRFAFRRPSWWLVATKPLLWVPLLAATESYIKGYRDGYRQRLAAKVQATSCLARHLSRPP